MAQLPEQVRLSVVVTLERAVQMLDSAVNRAPASPDWTWVQGACLLLQSSLDLLTQPMPCSAPGLRSAVELAAKAGLCLASLAPENLTAALCGAEQLIAQAHAQLSSYLPLE
jgi:hypothetical protein